MSTLLGAGSFSGAIADGTSTILTLDPITFDGTTRASFEAITRAFLDSNNFGPTSSVEFHLYEDGVDLGIFAMHGWQSAQGQGLSIWRKALLTPSSGDRVYTIVAVSTNNTGGGPVDGSIDLQIINTPDSGDIVYVPRTTDFTGTNPWLSSGALTFDGATRVRIDGSCSRAHFFTPGTDGVARVAILLKEDGVSLGQIGELSAADTVLANLPIVDLPVWLSRFMTPSAGSHTYTIEPQVTSSDATFYAAAASYLPAFLRISSA